MLIMVVWSSCKKWCNSCKCCCGNIILGNNIASCKTATVGMAAYGGARIENAGTITVNEGVGMLLGVGATFSNTGNIFVKNGIGIEGPGTLTILEILLFYLVEWGQQLL